MNSSSKGGVFSKLKGMNGMAKANVLTNVKSGFLCGGAVGRRAKRGGLNLPGDVFGSTMGNVGDTVSGDSDSLPNTVVNTFDTVFDDKGKRDGLVGLGVSTGVALRNATGDDNSFPNDPVSF